MKVFLVVGARPNFVKIAPLVRVLNERRIDFKLVHTGQHYDWEMTGVFLRDLGVSEPDVYLDETKSKHARISPFVVFGLIMRQFEILCAAEKPDVIIVVGDVDSTLACAIVAAKAGIMLAHVEAGCRSYDRSMPEEINRILTDSLSNYCFATTWQEVQNLNLEGVSPKKTFLVGDVMIDSLLHNLPRIDAFEIPYVSSLPYVLATFHRPSNVDVKERLEVILQVLTELSNKMNIVFPIHPRTAKQMKFFGLTDSFVDGKNIHVMKPMGYLRFLAYMKGARFVLTDSGGIQVETTVLGIPCLTVRDNTEHTSTLQEGTNILVEADKEKILKAVDSLCYGKKAIPNRLWDGKAAERIIEILRVGFLNGDHL